MKTWRVLGLICASLLLGLPACGDSGTGGDKDTGTDIHAVKDDGGLDGGEDPPPDVEEDTGSDEQPDADDDANADAGLDSGSCEPLGCQDQGFNCGAPSDTCGGPLSCGTCKDGQTCGGGGKPYVCGCTAATCDSLSSERGTKVCGMIFDGCSAMLDCGNSCSGSNTCGGGPPANECGCTPNLGACAGKECGTADDGCGHAVQCGTSGGVCSENRECSANACACKADTTAFCTGKCGPQQTTDGCSVACTPCLTFCAAGDGVSCAGCECPAGPAAGSDDDEVCVSGTQTCCVPEPVATLCGAAVCGSKVNRCGKTVSCGTCGAGLACTADAKCENPTAAALIGKYAVRSTGFGQALSLVTRAEGLELVEIYRDSGGKLMMHEQSCWSGAYSKNTAGTAENVITNVTPQVSANLPATTIELDISGTASGLSGPKDWVRGIQPLSESAGGWRRGRPSYCPANGGAADPNHPDFAPSNDARALGAKKPWLAGGTCLCPALEFAVSGRAPCQNLTGARQTACLADPENLSLPYSSGGTAMAATVTDCRVVDDDLDGMPGTTAVLTATALGVTLQATIGSAAVTSNIFWGAVDTTSAKRHWGVSQDQIGLQTSNVTCQGDGLLCGTSTGKFCPGYGGMPYDKDHRVNPVEFVSLHDKTAPAGGWASHDQSPAASCAEIYARRADSSWFTTVSWLTRYPSTATCNLAGN